jgi:hypothetical protein
LAIRHRRWARINPARSQSGPRAGAAALADEDRDAYGKAGKLPAGRAARRACLVACFVVCFRNGTVK